MAPLASVRVKTARAKTHLDELGAVLKAFAQSRPYDIAITIDAATGDQLFTVSTEPAAAPDLPQIGDTLYNLRSALDHLAWQLVDRAGGQPGKHTSFPICETAAKFDAGGPKSQMTGMNPDMHTRIRTWQPCFSRNRNISEALLALDEYGVIDKHRHLLTVPTSTEDLLWNPGGNPVHIHKGAVTKGTVLVRFPSDQHQSSLHVMPSVAFGEPPLKGEEVHRSLYFMHHVVELIIDDFEVAFFGP